MERQWTAGKDHWCKRNSKVDLVRASGPQPIDLPSHCKSPTKKTHPTISARAGKIGPLDGFYGNDLWTSLIDGEAVQIWRTLVQPVQLVESLAFKICQASSDKIKMWNELNAANIFKWDQASVESVDTSKCPLRTSGGKTGKTHSTSKSRARATTTAKERLTIQDKDQSQCLQRKQNELKI